MNMARTDFGLNSNGEQMRLTCPNCGAHYEVPDEVIPQDGRDVQCSNCGVTWFQAHPDTLPALPQGDAEAFADLPYEPPVEQPVENPAEQPVDEASDQSADHVEAPTPAGADALDEYDRVYDDQDRDEDALEDPAAGTIDQDVADTVIGAERRSLDPSVADILREEAEHEASLRATESAPLETQTEMGLDGAAPSGTSDSAATRARARERMVQATGAEVRDPTEPPASSRRDLLPDIEEINSTLRTDGERSALSRVPQNDAAASKARNSGFARGFAVVMVIAAAVVFAYANAPEISQKLPQADSALNSLVAIIDKARIWLDAQVKGFIG